MRTSRQSVIGLFVILILCIASVASAADPLPSWNDGAVKTKILKFVDAVTKEGGKSYVKPEERVAVFDNDGTLWVEQPIFPQAVFILEKVKELLPKHPDWKTTQPYKGLLDGNMQEVGVFGAKGMMGMLISTYSGSTAKDFAKAVNKWIAKAKHPRFERLYTELVYQPQLELMTYLRSKGFKTFIVSGGGREFMRAWTEPVYGVPPEQVVGSSVLSEFWMVDNKPVMVRLPHINFICNKSGKPVGIYKQIGRRPILAFGNSDADMQMIQYTKAGKGKRLALFVHHTDAEREYAYDRKSHVGRLDKVLDMAKANNWIIVDMKKDWRQIFPRVD